MKKLLRELFYVPKYGKVKEKVMVAHAVRIVTVVMACLIAMSVTAYAYFSHDVASKSNVLRGASFETRIRITLNDQDIDVVTDDYITHTAQLKGGEKYFVTAEHTERSTAKTGFVIVTATNCDLRYNTQQLGKDGEGNTGAITFWLCPTADTEVTFLAHWGTSSSYANLIALGQSSEPYILNGDEVILSVTVPQEETPATEEENPETEEEIPTTEEETPTTEEETPAIEEETPETEEETPETEEETPETEEETPTTEEETPTTEEETPTTEEETPTTEEETPTTEEETPTTEEETPETEEETPEAADQTEEENAAE